MPFPRQTLAQYAQKLAQQRLVTGTEGNLSWRTKEGIYTTPSGRFKEDLRPEDIVLLDEEGRVLEGGQPSSELPMHLAIYRARPEVKAVIHAHPPYTLALELAGHDFSETHLIEAALFLGEIQTVPFAVPGTEEVPEKLGPFLSQGKVFVLSRHGAVTLGQNLAEAFNLMCILEKVSQVVWLAKSLNKELPSLSPEEKERLKRL